MAIHELRPSALEQIDSRPLSRHHKSLIGLVIVLNISKFFDMFLIGFVVSLLTKPWNLSGTQTGIILACSGLGTVIGAIGALIVAFSTRAGESGSWMIFFAGILITMAFGDGAFGILNAFGGEQFPNEARGTGLGLGYGIGASAKIIGPLIMGVMIGGSALQQEVTLRAVFPAFILFAALLFVGGIFYLFAKETKGASLEEI